MGQNQVDYVKQSLLNQIADYASRLAMAEDKLAKVTIELEEYRSKEIAEMDEQQSEAVAK